ncbi:MAG: PAS domain-containing protein [Planctomycetota bacterium]|jgi:PAS domain S-box-containing protein
MAKSTSRLAVENLHDAGADSRHEVSAHLHDMLALSPAVIYRCGPPPDYPTTYISPNVADQLGYDPEDFYSDSQFWRHLLHPEDAERIVRQLDSVGLKFRIEYEYRLRRRNGTYAWIHDQLSPVHDTEGNLTSLVGSWIDVTARRHTAAIHKTQSHVLATLVAGSSLQETLTELALAFERQSPGLLCSILVYDAFTNTLGQGCAPSLPDAYNEAINGVGVGPNVGSCGTAVFRRERVVVEDIEKDPLWKDFRGLAREHGLRACWSQPIMGDGNCVLGTFAMYYREPRGPTPFELQLIEGAANLAAISIQRKRADNALRASWAKYQDLYAHAPDMFVSVNVQTDAIAECNNTLLMQSGYTKDEIIGRNIYDLYQADCVESAKRAFAEFARTGSVRDIELRLRRKDGGSLDVSLNVSAAYDEKGEIRFSRSILRDITERKGAEKEAREHHAALTHAYRLISMGEFAGALAHELNQPLCAIVSNAQAGLRLFNNNTPDLKEIRATLADIVGQGDRAGQVIRGLREFLRKERPQKVSLQINDAIRGALALAGLDGVRAEDSIHLEMAEELPDVLGDLIQLEQVVLNLVRNGLESARELHAGSCELVVRSRRDDDKIEVAVIDNGVGLSSDTAVDVFAPFFTTKPEGLGMGLWICQSIVEAHGGRLWATPNSGQGATFRFLLPIEQENVSDA